MASWQTVRIGQIGRVVTGKTPPSERPDEFGDIYPFITPSDIPYTKRHIKVERYLSERGMESHRRMLLPKKSVCVVCIGATVGKICMTNEPSISNQQINSIIPTKGEFDSNFVYYISTTLKDSLVAFSGGAATPIINKSTFSSIKLLVPRFKEQQKIASILAAYDDLIETNQRRINLLEKMAEEIYREWFICLRFPGHEKIKVIKGVPNGWAFDKANEFIGIVKGKSYAGEELTEDETQMPFVNLKSFNRGGGYRSDGLKFYSGKYRNEQLVKHKDVVMAVTDMTQDRAVIGQVARMPNFGEKGAVISLDTVKLVPKNIDKTFLYAYMKHSGFPNFIKEFANGANVLHLKPDLITKQKIIIPPKELQTRFAAIVEPLYDQSDMLNEANIALAKTRDMLLPRLISGKLSVEHLDIQFPHSMLDESVDQIS